MKSRKERSPSLRFILRIKHSENVELKSDSRHMKNCMRWNVYQVRQPIAITEGCCKSIHGNPVDLSHQDQRFFLLNLLYTRLEARLLIEQVASPGNRLRTRALHRRVPLS